MKHYMIATSTSEFGLHARGPSAGAGRSGSVLLEALIAIPLFMMLIGGILWIGDLILARQKLLVADRYAAWNSGNRYRNQAGNAPDVQAEIQQRIFLSASNQVVTVHVSNGEANRWSQEVWGGADLWAQMPALTEGWLSMGTVMWGLGDADSAITSKVQAIHGREIPPGPSGLYEGHKVVMRSNYDDGRSDPGSVLADVNAGWSEQAWNPIYSEEWVQ